MDVYLIRHSPVAVDKGVCYGTSDVSLAADCESHFALMKEKLEGITPSLVYSSPAQRCTHLAHHLKPKSDVITDPRLLELNFGAWELKSWNELPQEQLRHWTENYIHEAPPGGENYHQLFERVKSFWEEKIASANVESVFIITHGGVIRSILSFLLEIPLHKSFSLEVELCSVCKMEVKEGFFTIKYLNR